jgi:hypothetical protein
MSILSDKLIICPVEIFLPYAGLSTAAELCNRKPPALFARIIGIFGGLRRGSRTELKHLLKN